MEKEQELLLCEDYKNKMYSTQICKKYHCSTNTLQKIIANYGISKRQTHNTKKDLSKFYDLTSPETQYWLGYLCADGNVEYGDNKVYKDK